jgi:hypothetical protein
MVGGGKKKIEKPARAVRACDVLLVAIAIARCADVSPLSLSLLPIRQVASSTKSSVGSGHLCHKLSKPDFSERNLSTSVGCQQW